MPCFLSNSCCYMFKTVSQVQLCLPNSINVAGKPWFSSFPCPLFKPLAVPPNGLIYTNKRPNVSDSQAHKEEEQSEEQVKFFHGKSLSDLSTWAIGGPCKYFCEFSNQAQLLSAIRYCCQHSICFLVIGKGSNCLFDDRGFDGCVMLNRINFLERIGYCAYRVGSGYPFNRLGIQCSNEGFSGLEFASGIPGTVGGAAFMNAGANGQETADVIDSIEIVTVDGRHGVLERSESTFGYRRSPFQDMEELAAITAVTFRLTPSISARQRQQAFLSRRKKSQPIRERSAGSVFRNPLGLELSAGELIEKAGLKGFTVGGAKVSDLHANFFINFNHSTSKDMVALIGLVKEEVYRKFGVELEEEIQYFPYH